MKSLHKVIKRVLRYEIGIFLKNSNFSYLYGSISYLFGCEKNRCFFLMFITAGPSTKLFAWGGGDIGGHVLRGPAVIKHRDDDPRPVWTVCNVCVYYCRT